MTCDSLCFKERNNFPAVKSRAPVKRVGSMFIVHLLFSDILVVSGDGRRSCTDCDYDNIAMMVVMYRPPVSEELT
jgi:hypothetical protein